MSRGHYIDTIQRCFFMWYPLGSINLFSKKKLFSKGRANPAGLLQAFQLLPGRKRSKGLELVHQEVRSGFRFTGLYEGTRIVSIRTARSQGLGCHLGPWKALKTCMIVGDVYLILYGRSPQHQRCVAVDELQERQKRKDGVRTSVYSCSNIRENWKSLVLRMKNTNLFFGMMFFNK